MGYYSDVAIALNDKDFKNLIISASKKSPDAMALIKSAQLITANGLYTLSWSTVKWYEDYVDVSFIEDFLQECHDYGFLRIGENTEDIEMRDNGDICWWNSFGIVKYIDVFGHQEDTLSTINKIIANCETDESKENSPAQKSQNSIEDFYKILEN